MGGAPSPVVDVDTTRPVVQVWFDLGDTSFLDRGHTIVSRSRTTDLVSSVEEEAVETALEHNTVLVGVAEAAETSGMSTAAAVGEAPSTDAAVVWPSASHTPAPSSPPSPSPSHTLVPASQSLPSSVPRFLFSASPSPSVVFAAAADTPTPSVVAGIQYRPSRSAAAQPAPLPL